MRRRSSALLAMIRPGGAPKRCSSASAVEWKVEARTPSTPSAASRARSSPAALSVKVTATSSDGGNARLAADVEPTFGSGGKPVFIPGYKQGRPFYTAFTLENTGRFRVTVTGLSSHAAEADALGPVGLLVTDSATASADPSHLHRFHR